MNKNELELKLNEIQNQMVPSWDSLHQEEQDIIKDLYYKWELSVANNFNRLNRKQKRIVNLAINEKKLIEKGAFDFDANKSYLEKIKLEIFQNKLFKSNSRLLLKSIRKLIECFESLRNCKNILVLNESSDFKLYWFYFNKSLNDLKITVLRIAFFVHEAADLNKASIGLPPIYALESDNSDNKQDLPQLKLETLYQYVYLCANYLRIIVANEKKKSKTNNYSLIDQKSKYHKLILKCLIHLMQVSFTIRDDLITKNIKHSKADFESDCHLTDIDLYSQFIRKECNLLEVYLKNI